VIAVVLAMVLLLELFIRQYAHVLDWDREHIHQFREIIAELDEKPGERIIFFGNSLMEKGIDPEIAEAKLEEVSGMECSVEKIVPVGTAIVDWIYLYDTYFNETGQHPDIIVIGFVAHHLPDVEEVKIRRLARHFCSSKNFIPCLATELDDFETRSLGFWSRYSAIYGDQQEIQLRALSPVVPHYGYGTRKVSGIIERAAERKAEKKNEGKVPPPKTYHNLKRLIAMLKDAGVKAYFVPMPQPEVWDLDPNLVRTIEDSGMQIIDARAISTITPADFSDGYHLDHNRDEDETDPSRIGDEKFSDFMGQKLGEDLKKSAE